MPREVWPHERHCWSPPCPRGQVWDSRGCCGLSQPLGHPQCPPSEALSPRSQGGGRPRAWLEGGSLAAGVRATRTLKGGGVLAFQGALPVASNEVLGEQVMKLLPGLREAGRWPDLLHSGPGAAPPPRFAESLRALTSPHHPPASHFSFPTLLSRPGSPPSCGLWAQGSGSMLSLIPLLKSQWELRRGT